jgi:SAM-dependent methyltransferase
MPYVDYSKVAEWYDLWVQVDFDIPFFLQEAQGCRSVLELTSGTGRVSLPLIRAHVPLSCLDSSAEMLAILRRKLHEQGLSAPVYEMDATSFALPQQFDLIIIPFNSFSEFADPAAQRQVLATVRSHLEDGGRLIVTLHNPQVRLKTIHGQVHPIGKYALPDGTGTLFLSNWERYDPGTQLVTGALFYELYDREGILQSKRLVEGKFYLHSRQTFEALLHAGDYQVLALYGNYERAAFDAEQSPFMIWVLRMG